jgi:hypothetical protein
MPQPSAPAAMTLDQLLATEHQLKPQVTASAFAIGLAIGIAVWSATHGGFLLPILLGVVACAVGARNAGKAQALTQVRAELRRRRSST